MPKGLYEFAAIIEHGLAPSPFSTMFQQTTELFSAAVSYSNNEKVQKIRFTASCQKYIEFCIFLRFLYPEQEFDL